MRTIIFILLFISTYSYAQNDTLNDLGFNKDTIPYKWPYIKNRTPPFIGLLVGYNLYSDPNVEFGTIINLSDNYGNTKGGTITGPSITYKRYLEKDLNSISLDLGFYGFLAAGMGMNYNFSKHENLIGFKPFLGLALYNFQMTYSYNFFSKRKNENLDLGHHNVNVKLTIPICEILKKYK